jgi:hypothetical protein
LSRYVPRPFLFCFLPSSYSVYLVETWLIPAPPDLGELYISEKTEKCSAELVAEFMGKTIKTPLQQKRAELRLARGLTTCLFDSSGPNQDDEGRRTEFNDRLRWLSRTQETLAAEIKEVANGGAVLGYDTKNNAAAT